MKNKAEELLFESALRRNAAPGTVVSVLLLDLPETNGSIRFCIYRHTQYCQLVAGLQELTTDILTFRYPTLSRHCIGLPEPVVRYIRWKLKRYGISHLNGVLQCEEEIGRALTVH